jgi:hypothetical protein
MTMDVTHENLKFPPDYNEVRPQTEEATPFVDSHKPSCPSCRERWRIDEGAQAAVSITMHCMQPWLVVVCPACKVEYMITGSGKSHSQAEDNAFVLSVSQYWIARVRA